MARNTEPGNLKTLYMSKREDWRKWLEENFETEKRYGWCSRISWSRDMEGLINTIDLMTNKYVCCSVCTTTQKFVLYG